MRRSFLLAGVFGATVLSAAFFAATPHRSPAGVSLGHVAICMAVGGALGALGWFLMDKSDGGFFPLLVVWQPGMAFIMALLAEPRQQESDQNSDTGSVERYRLLRWAGARGSA